MDIYIKKYFWTVPVLTIAVCAYFAAGAATHIVEAKALPDSDKLGKATKRVTKPKKVAIKSKVGKALADRNMFCPECLPEEVVEEAVGGIDSDSPPLTSLPLSLVATNVSTEAAYSFATIQNTSTDRQGSYSLEQDIPGGGPVVRISTKYVDFTNTKTRRVERLSLLSTSTARKTPTATVASNDKKPKKGDKNAWIKEGVNKVSDTEFELDKKVVDKLLANPMAMASGARIVPSIKDGKPQGFKLYAIRPSSVFATIGLMNGDTLHSVNGFELTSAEGALEVYGKVKEATNLSVNITRRGKPVSLQYTIK